MPLFTEQEQKEWNELSAVVKTGGFLKLDSHEKRNRYKELKKRFDEGGEVLRNQKGKKIDDKAEVPATREESKIMMTKGELREMLDSHLEAYKKEAIKMYEKSGGQEAMDEVMKIGKWMKEKKYKPQNHTAKLRVYRADGVSEPGIIIDWRFLKKAFNEDTRKYDIPLYQITVLYDDDTEKTYEIPIQEMTAIQEFEVVEIIKKDVEDQVLVQGRGQKPYTKGGYSFSSPSFFGTKQQMLPGETFDYEVKRQEITCTIKRPNGKVLTLDSSRLNG